MGTHHYKPHHTVEFKGDPRRLTSETGVSRAVEAILLRDHKAFVVVDANGYPYTDANGNHFMADKENYLITGAKIMNLNGKEVVITAIPSRMLPSDENVRLAQQIGNYFHLQQEPRRR